MPRRAPCAQLSRPRLSRHRAPQSTGGAGRHRVLDALLLLLQLDLGGRADLDHVDPTRQLGEPLLQLLTVVVGVGTLDLGLDLADAGLDLLLVALASMIVVSSLVTTTLRARPSRSRVTFSSLRPTSSLITCLWGA
jgi:hypothetical protein